MEWEGVDLSTRRLFAAPFGGPIAVVRDESRLVAVRPGGAAGGGGAAGAGSGLVVRIFSAAGREQGSFVWDGGRVATMGWTRQQELLLLDEGGQARALVALEAFGGVSGFKEFRV
jgi:hypothetical protein